MNKGSAFQSQERAAFNLNGLLPETVETIGEQSDRAYKQFGSFGNDIDKHIYLRNIQDTNETLFYHLLDKYLVEMMPIIYTPTVGVACENFSNIYRRGRGLFVAYPQRDRIEEILNNVTNNDVKIIVVTDGERILGLGDQGIGGMGIPIGKLSLYTACAGISPTQTLPIVLDVGTNNTMLLSDPMYMGWRNARINKAEYNDFVDDFIASVKRRWPGVLIQFEDFAQQNAMPLLARYQKSICCFNDDIQGTAAVAVGSLLAACHSQGSQLSEKRVCIAGGGSAGCGIGEAIIAQMVSEGLPERTARNNIYVVDKLGLLLDSIDGLYDFQEALAQPSKLVDNWDYQTELPSLLDVMHHVKPDILIGVTGVAGLFSKDIVSAMYQYCKQPIIFPLSNPTPSVEALPEDIFHWTEGNAIVATGSPFAPVLYDGQWHKVSQCNNSYVFPGVGLGCIAVGASEVSNSMFMESSRILAQHSPLVQGSGHDLLPLFDNIKDLSREIAFNVAKQAVSESLAPPFTDAEIMQKIDAHNWRPVYRRYCRIAC